MRAIIASLESAQISQQYTKAMFLTAAKMEEMIEEYGFSARRSGETTLANYEGVDGDTYAYEITVDPDRKRLVFVLRVKTIWVHRGSTKSYELYCETPMRRLIKDYAR